MLKTRREIELLLVEFSEDSCGGGLGDVVNGKDQIGRIYSSGRTSTEYGGVPEAKTSSTPNGFCLGRGGAPQLATSKRVNHASQTF